MAKDIADLAREALLVQDACNLSGVAHGFARAMGALSDMDLNTETKNTHPIAILWADKIAHLTGTQSLGNDKVMEAYTVVSRMAGIGAH